LDSIWDIFKPEELIRSGGKFLLLSIVFLENGIFFGFFLPGDSLLFTAGLLCYLKILNIPLTELIAGISVAALLGYYAGYLFGIKTGQALYNRPDTLFYKKKYIVTAEEFYKKFGGLALVMGRFLPIVRTFAPILAGVVRVNPFVFSLYNILGAILWPLSIVSSGFFTAKFFPGAQQYLDWIVVGFILVTSVPIIRTWFKEKKNQTEI
jgi:membrane-associated protein